MTRLISVCVALAFSTLRPYCNTDDPAWIVGMRKFGYQSAQWGADTGVKFTGPFLVVYSGSIFSRSMTPKLVFDKDTGQLVPWDLLAGISLPPWDECQRTIVKRPFPYLNAIDCWDSMTIQQVGGIGRGEERGEAKYYLDEPGKDKVLLFRGRCNTDPHFVGKHHILVRLCNGRRVVVDNGGRKLYDMPKLFDAYIAPNREGTRFIVYERDSSLIGQFTDQTDRKRLKVFRSSDGEKLFEYHWGQIEGDRLNDGRVALSDDGSLAALIRGTELIVFAIDKPTSTLHRK